MYVDYNYYSNTYGGKVTVDNFNSLLLKATATLNYHTFNRIKIVDENIKLAICELIDLIHEEEQNEGKEIESEKVGSYSVTYSKENKISKSRKEKKIINKYLGHTNLLYRGI